MSAAPFLLQYGSELANRKFTMIDDADRIDVHDMFHDILKSAPGKTARSITEQLISRSDDGALETSSIQLKNMDKLNKFVPTSSFKDDSDGDVTVR